MLDDLFPGGVTLTVTEITEETVVQRLETAFSLTLSVMPRDSQIADLEAGLLAAWESTLTAAGLTDASVTILLSGDAATTR